MLEMQALTSVYGRILCIERLYVLMSDSDMLIARLSVIE